MRQRLWSHKRDKTFIRNCAYTRKTYKDVRRSEDMSPSIFYSCIWWRFTTIYPGCLIPENSTGTLWMAEVKVSRTGLDADQRKNIYTPVGNQAVTLSPSSLYSHYNDWNNQALPRNSHIARHRSRRPQQVSTNFVGTIFCSWKEVTFLQWKISTYTKVYK
jgi:hypothetical protein